MATREELENRLLPDQFVTLGQQYVNPIDPFKYQELVHNPQTAIKQSVYTSFYTKENIEFGSRIARVIAVEEVNTPSNFGYFSNQSIAQRVKSRYYSVLCHVPDHDAAIPQAAPVVNADTTNLSILDASKTRLLQKFYVQIGGEAQSNYTPIVGDFVEVDYQDRTTRSGGFIKKLIQRDEIASENSNRNPQARDSFKNANANFNGSPNSPIKQDISCDTPDDKLSDHFTFCQMTRTGQTRYLETNREEAKQFLDAGKALCQTILEPIYEKFGPVNVHSGFRGPSVNSAVGGSKTSQHMKFEACDFHCENATLQQVFDWIRKDSGLPYGQVILEGKTPSRPTWIHVSLGEPFRARSQSRQAKTYNGSNYTTLS